MWGRKHTCTHTHTATIQNSKQGQMKVKTDWFCLLTSIDVSKYNELLTAHWWWTKIKRSAWQFEAN